ncbi:MAG: hypothetical protein LBR51_08105 [Bacteroidales bacterium]|nr:hypothetical protein [Bacteroidales bacterium]
MIANAQSNAIGLRLTYGAELSFQHDFSDRHRIEADLGLEGFYGMHLAGIFQWQWDIAAVNGLKWYVGPGIGVGYMWGWFGYGGIFHVGVLGDIGIEYTFQKVPIQLAVDYRPGVYFATGGLNFWPSFYGAGFAIRYKF